MTPIAPRPTGTPDETEFDLARLVWGNLPLDPAPPSRPGHEQAGDSPSSRGAEVGFAQPNGATNAPSASDAQTFLRGREDDGPPNEYVVREAPAPWDTMGQRGQVLTAASSRQANDEGDAIDLDAITAMAELDLAASAAADVTAAHTHRPARKRAGLHATS